MTLFRLNDIVSTDADRDDGSRIFRSKAQRNICVGTPGQSLKKYIGIISKNEMINYWTFGRWSMHDLLIYILKQTGTADVLVTTWSISEGAMRDILIKYREGLIKSIKFLIDPRIKVRNPVPLQLLAANFPYKFTACHAKVCTIENDEWKISIVSSANMTNNPRFERGVIFTMNDVFEFDKKAIEDEFARN